MLFVICIFLVEVCSSTLMTSSTFESESLIKEDFIGAIRSRDVGAASSLVEQNPFLTARFDQSLFTEVLRCYEQENSEIVCEPFYELLEPSFADLSQSETTPFIMSIEPNSFPVFNKLVLIPAYVKVCDSLNRSALVHAVKMGRRYMFARILRYGVLSADEITELLNVRESENKTILHHVCESNLDDDHKIHLIRDLKALGAIVVDEVPFAVNFRKIDLLIELLPEGSKWKIPVLNSLKLLQLSPDFERKILKVLKSISFVFPVNLREETMAS